VVLTAAPSGRKRMRRRTAVSVQAIATRSSPYLKRGEDSRRKSNAGGIKLDLPPTKRHLPSWPAGSAHCGRPMRWRLQDDHPPRQRPARAQAMNTLLRLTTVELLRPHLDTPVNVINVEHLARSRGIELVQVPEPSPRGPGRDIIGIRADSPNGESHRVLGTVYADGLPRVLRVDGFAMDMVPEGTWF